MLDDATALTALRDGELSLVGRLVDSTNNALVGTVSLARSERTDPLVLGCVYKPTRGERPLVDFPPGTLSKREVAAYLVSEAIGWRIVPPTVYRDGPFGPGMLQLWIEADPDVDPVQLVVAGDRRLRRIATFDAAVNNTDRKAGHLLPDPGGHVYGVDHGVCFSIRPKLRTVLWDWRSEPFEDDERAALRTLRRALDAALAEALAPLLAPDEVAAMVERVDGLLEAGRFPEPSPDWPAVPWPLV